MSIANGIIWRRHVDHLKTLPENSSSGTLSSDQAEPDEVIEENVYYPFTQTTPTDIPASQGAQQLPERRQHPIRGHNMVVQ